LRARLVGEVDARREAEPADLEVRPDEHREGGAADVVSADVLDLRGVVDDLRLQAHGVAREVADIDLDDELVAGVDDGIALDHHHRDGIHEGDLLGAHAAAVDVDDEHRAGAGDEGLHLRDGGRRVDRDRAADLADGGGPAEDELKLGRTHARCIHGDRARKARAEDRGELGDGEARTHVGVGDGDGAWVRSRCIADCGELGDAHAGRIDGHGGRGPVGLAEERRELRGVELAREDESA